MSANFNVERNSKRENEKITCREIMSEKDDIVANDETNVAMFFE